MGVRVGGTLLITLGGGEGTSIGVNTGVWLGSLLGSCIGSTLGTGLCRVEGDAVEEEVGGALRARLGAALLSLGT